MRQSNIQLTIFLDEKNIPETIEWESSDGDKKKQKAKAMMIALWDEQQRNGISIDLWTKEMTIEEMNIFFFQTLTTMSDTFERATQNKKVAAGLKDFAQQFFDEVQKGPVANSQ